MRRALLLALLLSPLAILAILFWRTAEDAPETPAERSVVHPSAVPEPERIVPVVPRELEITGRILTPELKPAAGIEVVCGDERAVSAADGTFQFPGAARPGRRFLSIREGGRELIRWGDVVTGAVAPDGSENPASWTALEALNPERIRWTINLGRGAHLMSGESGAAPLPDGAFAVARGILIQDWGNTGEVRIEGVANLPDGAHIDSTLYFENERTVASIERAEVRGGFFSAVIQFPAGFHLHAGTYQLHLLFGLLLEDPRQVERWREERPDLDWSGMLDREVIQDIYAGDPAEEMEENWRIEQQFGEILTSIRRLQRILLYRSRRARYLARRWDPEVIQAELEVEKLSLGGRLLAESGKFDFSSWRRFLDRGLRPEIFRILALHEQKKSSKYRRANFLLESVLKRLLLISKIESILVYQAWGLPIHPDDFYLDEEQPLGDEHAMLNIQRKDLEFLQRFRDLTGRVPAVLKLSPGAPFFLPPPWIWWWCWSRETE